MLARVKRGIFFDRGINFSKFTKCNFLVHLGLEPANVQSGYSNEFTILTVHQEFSMSGRLEAFGSPNHTRPLDR